MGSRVQVEEEGCGQWGRVGLVLGAFGRDARACGKGLFGWRIGGARIDRAWPGNVREGKHLSMCCAGA